MLKPHSILADHRDERRFRLLQRLPQESSSFSVAIWRVLDLKLEREVFLACLDYASIPKDRLSWDIPDLRKSFEGMAKALSCNAIGLPEPLDFFYFKQPSLPEPVRDGEPALVLSPTYGSPLWFPPLHDKKSKSSPQRRSALLRNLCLHVAYTLGDLHQRGLLLRALPKAGLRRHTSTHAILLSFYQTLLAIRDFRGYQPHAPAIHPSPRHAAPECFHEKPVLTPACDVYSLGRLLLEVLGETLTERPFSPEEIEAICAKHQLEPYWLRFFQLALHPLPEHRFDGMVEIKRFIASRGSADSFPSSRPANVSSSLRTRRSDAPPAALLVWEPSLVLPRQRFDYHSLVSSLQSRFSLSPLLFFTAEQQDSQNSFYQFLRNLSFEILTFRRGTPSTPLLRDSFARWQTLPHVIVVGSYPQDGCRELLRLAQKAGASIELFSTTPVPPSDAFTLRPTQDFFSDKATTQRR